MRMPRPSDSSPRSRRSRAGFLKLMSVSPDLRCLRDIACERSNFRLWGQATSPQGWRAATAAGNMRFVAPPSSFSPLSSTAPHILIIGAGHSGGRAAEALRAAGHPGAITLLGNERHPPYERPPLSKDLLLGKIGHERTFLKPADFYEAQGIALILGRTAVAIDRAGQRVTLDDGSALPYDLLLLTTGARPRRLPAADGPRIHYLRDIEDALAL